MKYRGLFLRVFTAMRSYANLTVPQTICGPGNDSFRLQGFKPLQFLTCLCILITTNKKQRQSSGKAEFSVCENCFWHGYWNVWLSRAPRPANILLLCGNADRKPKKWCILKLFILPSWFCMASYHCMKQ